MTKTENEYLKAADEYLHAKLNLDPATAAAAGQKLQALKAKVARENGDANMTAEINKLTAGMGLPGRGGARGNSLGHQFVASETFEYLRKHRGKFPASWTSPTSELMGGDMMAATLSEDAASGGDLVVTDNQPGIVDLPMRPLRLEQLIRSGQTSSNTIGYMKETAFTNAAEPVAEGNAKPESTLTFVNATDAVQKVTHWLPVTEEMLEDVPAIRSYVDARLRLGVNLALDDELLNGALASAPHITGFLNRAGLASAVVRAGSVTNADAILEQIVAIETATNMEVDGIVMNQTNWKTILMSKDGEGRYYGGGPLASPARPVLWGRPVALTSAIVANTALVGAFGTAAQLFSRGGMQVTASNSHEDFFVRGLLAIQASRRCALAVYRPAAFGVVSSMT